MILISRIDTPIGEMAAGATRDGICLLEFPDRKRLSTACSDLSKLLSETIEEGENQHIMLLREQLAEYFEGRRQEFAVNLIMAGTPFQQQVWRELLSIPYGTTRTYAEQATALGNLEAIRAVASANGKNRMAIIIPCHRVIGSDGKLTGYGGGLQRKRWLLGHERKYSARPDELSLF